MYVLKSDEQSDNLEVQIRVSLYRGSGDGILIYIVHLSSALLHLGLPARHFLHLQWISTRQISDTSSNVIKTGTRVLLGSFIHPLFTCEWFKDLAQATDRPILVCTYNNTLFQGICSGWNRLIVWRVPFLQECLHSARLYTFTQVGQIFQSISLMHVAGLQIQAHYSMQGLPLLYLEKVRTPNPNFLSDTNSHTVIHWNTAGDWPFSRVTAFIGRFLRLLLVLKATHTS